MKLIKKDWFMNGFNGLFPNEKEKFSKLAQDTCQALIAHKFKLAERTFEPANGEFNNSVLSVQDEGIAPEEGVDLLINKIFKHQSPTDHPRNFSFIPSPVSPLSWLAGFITDSFNPHAASLWQSEGPVEVEEALIQLFNKKIGFPASAGGIFVSGGSMGNLTALTIARDQKLNEHSRYYGVAYVSDQTHSSVIKGLRVIGLVDRQIRVVKTDANFRMDLDDLKEQLYIDKQRGLIPFTVIATAGTTNTGSIDPLDEIADVCAEHDLWMHVDGAFGASIALSNSFAHLLKGLERADSLIWDAHKWLFQTYACGLLLMRDKALMAQSFSIKPEYLQDVEQYDKRPNFMDLGIELTRPARAVKLWFTLKVVGMKAIGHAIDRGVKLAIYLEKQLALIPEVEIVSKASLGVVNFRFAPYNLALEEQDLLNRKVCRMMQQDGYAQVVTTQLNGRTVIRLCSINPLTKKEDLDNTTALLKSFVKPLRINTSKNQSME